jgi:molecular chaperone GrpE
MDNSLNTEQELGKHEETGEEVPAGQTPEPEPAKEAAAIPDPLKKLQDDLAEARDKYVRLYAEFENHRRRTAKEKMEMIQGANEALLKSLLPVIDDFDRAEKAFKDQTGKEAEGFILIHNKFKKTLEQYGVREMEITVDSKFDAEFHEAITQVPVTDETKKGKIVDVVERGYLLNDKVLRFAKVVVGS